MIEDFMNWWGDQLFDLIPARFRAGDPGAANALVVELCSGVEVQLWLRRNNQEIKLGRFILDATGIMALRAALPRKRPRSVVLRAPGVVLLERQVVLPLAAERERASVLRFEMDRLTPFAAGDVFWTSAVERRDPARGKITLLLSMIPKVALAPAIAALREAGLVPAIIEAGGPAGSRRLIPLATMNAGGPWRGAEARILVGICAALALIAIILPFALQARRSAAIEHDIARMRPAVAKAEALRQRILAGAASANVIARQRVKIADPLAVLAAVTKALPDNTFLTELTLRHLKLTLAGKSASAAPLLSALSADPLLAGAAFSAPVTRDSADHDDLFSITARIAPAAGAAR
jgi:general secretion pathway protein L